MGLSSITLYFALLFITSSCFGLNNRNRDISSRIPPEIEQQKRVDIEEHLQNMELAEAVNTVTTAPGQDGCPAPPEPEVSCFDELTGLPYCMGVSTAENICSSYPEATLIRAKEAFHEFVEEGTPPRSAIIMAFAGGSSDVTEECR